MSSYAEIANLAAITIGTAARLTLPGEDTVLGRAVASVWDIERLAALREGSWNFAIKREQLAASDQAPKHQFSKQFQLPADCLRLIEVYRLSPNFWQLEGRRILADHEGALDIRYLRDVTEPAEFDPQFAYCFALRIASSIGNRIAGSSFNEETVWRKYRQALSEAKRNDAIENPPIEQHESEWITRRWLGGDLVDRTRIDGFGNGFGY